MCDERKAFAPKSACNIGIIGNVRDPFEAIENHDFEFITISCGGLHDSYSP